MVWQVPTNAGAAGGGAAAELSRRLMVQLRDAAEATAQQNDRLTKLTLWLVLLTVGLLLLTTVLAGKEWWG